MNVFSYEEITLGQEVSFTAAIGPDSMKAFAELTGDRNPRHTEQGVVYGMLTGSFLSTLAGMYLPGKYALIQSVRLEFVSPIVLSATGEKTPIVISGVVNGKEDRFRLLSLKVSVSGEDGTKFLFGTMKVKVTDDE